MSNPGTSVVDRLGRCHDVPNVFIIDGSIFTTSACINPASTIQALALRTADYLKGEGRDSIRYGHRQRVPTGAHARAPSLFSPGARPCP